MGSRHARPLDRGAAGRARPHRRAPGRRAGACSTNTRGARRSREILKGCFDLERIAQKVRFRRALPRDLASLRRTLDVLRPLASSHAAGARTAGRAHRRLRRRCSPTCSAALVDEPPAQLADGGVIRPEAHPELAECVVLRTDARSKLSRARRARARTNRHQVAEDQIRERLRLRDRGRARASAGSVPADYVRKQTLTTGERYITPELKELELAISTAQARQERLELQLFDALLDRVAARTDELLRAADALAEIDVLAALAQCAAERGYVRPSFVDESIVSIEEGRHPVMEAILHAHFVPNDLLLRAADHRFILLTGPNMGGKSTYLAPGRPARRSWRRSARSSRRSACAGRRRPHLHAHRRGRRSCLGAVDLLYGDGRSGEHPAPQHASLAAADRRSRPRNRNARRTLDRAGDLRVLARARRASADGAVRDALSRVMRAGRHWELVANYHITAVENTARDGAPVFSHRVQPGSSSRSFGIEVARMAGLPDAVVERAQEIADALSGHSDVEAQVPLRRRISKQTAGRAAALVLARIVARYVDSATRRGDDRTDRRRRNHRAAGLGRQRARRERRRCRRVARYRHRRARRPRADRSDRRRRAASRRRILPLAVRRHATSKLAAAADLESIATLGFRGEGLASIAAVARLEIAVARSPTPTIGVARRARTAKRSGRSSRPRRRRHARARRALFENVPVRREYLRSPSAEFNRISSWLSTFALAYPARDLHAAPRRQGRLGRCRRRRSARTAWRWSSGATRRDALIPLDAGCGAHARRPLRGFISAPGSDRADRRMQLLFVNGRLLRSTLLARRVDGRLLDLRDDRAASVRRAVSRSAARSRRSERASDQERRAPALRNASLRCRAPRDRRDAAGARGRTFSRARRAGAMRAFRLRRPASIRACARRIAVRASRMANPSGPSRRSAAPALRVLAQLDRTFILASDGEALLLVDQHAAHERIAYETHRRARARERAPSEPLLVPLVVELDARAKRGARSRARAAARRRPRDRTVRRAHLIASRDAGRLRRARVRSRRIPRRSDRGSEAARRARAHLGVACVPFGDRRRASASSPTR